jgi:hypothetical protein|tara:strand:+ start:4778 stop:5335 length:558 start_codon:yes stop_codon:yes gene_type:complete
MYKLSKWNDLLDLSNFYAEAERRGFKNNSSQAAMIDCFRSEREWEAWILYKDGQAIGSVAAHSFDDVVPGGYRILTRVCTFAEARKDKGLITPKRLVAQHQNLTDQFLLPQCLKWVGDKGRVFATSNASKEASQRLVHSYYFPTLAKIGIVSKVKEVHYRHTDQTVWEIHPEKFYENLELYPRWV